MGVHNVNELNAALHNISRKMADAVIVSGETFFLDHKRELAESIRRAGLPSCFPYREYHEDGVLMTYGPSLKDMMRRVASYVPKVLSGVKPGELPVEQLSKHELIVDLRIGRELRIKVPEDLLLRADEVIRHRSISIFAALAIVLQLALPVRASIRVPQ